MSKDLTYVKFPVGTDKVYLNDICYELDRERDTLTISLEGNFYSFPDELATNLINFFGIGMVIILKILTMSISILLFFLPFLELILKGNDSPWSLPLIFTSCIFFGIFFYMSEIENYYNISRCNKCGRDFAYKEVKEPLIKMVST